MQKKIQLTLTSLILIVLPFLIGNSIGKYSPYVERNSFLTYVIIWALISVALAAMAFLLLQYAAQSFESIFIGGAFLFLLACPIVGIIGLVSAPDLSLKMLEHPEREHLRYLYLFLATFLFGIFTLFLYRSNFLKIDRLTSWVTTLVFILAFAEFIWEFTHHYFYPEALKDWVDQGKKAELFGKNYDNINIVDVGVFGRLIQYSNLRPSSPGGARGPLRSSATSSWSTTARPMERVNGLQKKRCVSPI
jgi:MFS family permease